MSLRTSCRYSTSLSVEEVEDLFIGTDEQPSIVSTISRRQVLVVAMLSTVNFCSSVFYSLIAPFYPKEAAKKGVSPVMIGFIFGILELTIALSSPFFGRFMTRLGSRFTFLAGMFTVGTACCLFGFVDMVPDGVDFVSLSIAIRVVEGLGAGAYITASFAIIANEFPERVATMFGVLETFNGLGLMLGPVVGGALYYVGGFGLPFYVLGGFILVAFVCAYFILPEQHDHSVPITKSYWTFLKAPSVAICMMIIAMGSMSMGFLQPTLEPHLELFNLNPFVIGLLFLLMSGAYAFSAPLWGYIGDKIGYPLQMMIAGCVFTALAFLFVGPSPIFKFHVNNGFPDNFETYGLLSGMYSTCFSLGAAIGPTVAGALVDYIGFPWGTSLFSAFNILLAVVLLFYICYFNNWCCHGVGETEVKYDRISSTDNGYGSVDHSAQSIAGYA
ncbi:PREDICTED: MFS-type transporter SLC18B1-like isoform X2 [Priapulus caudatus]|uniref:MFS-type transporter SLC18B1-like isoform X2 n=1 Tax=Priapulus caudatus TaxID=37621 RepID=A0ABM1DPM5_PRICU|nr:PREDICTED: MFS-type transporter SLC18B1-like isoform X2 [Priapulus caudatus]